MKAITPQECADQAGDYIPEVVIEAVNNLLKKGFRRGVKTVLKQDDIIAEVIGLDPNITREQIFKEGWMDFEPIFIRAGWAITYDKPGYNETYPPSFEFKAP